MTGVTSQLLYGSATPCIRRLGTHTGRRRVYYLPYKKTVKITNCQGRDALVFFCAPWPYFSEKSRLSFG